MRKGAAVELLRMQLYAAAMADKPSTPRTPVDLFRSPLLLDRRQSCLLVIDVQEKLLPLIDRAAVVQWNISRLLKGAGVLKVRVAATEQYPAGLGATVAPLREYFAEISEKRMFSGRECHELFADLLDRSLRQIVVAGIETHVCVLQTALDLVSAGFDVFAPADAVGSRTPLDHETALARMAQSGVTVTTTESVLFEWCETSAAAEFKQISQLVRRTSPE